MMPYSCFTLTRVIKVAIVLLCAGYSAAVYGSTILSGEEILVRMEKVKENFYSYKRTYKSDTDAVLHQSFAQSRPAGELLWTESTIVNNSDKNKPRKKITIIVCYEKMYDYYPDDNVAADISYLLQKVKKNAEKAKKEMEGAVVKFEPVKAVMYDNTDCYDVKTASVKDGKTIAEEHYIIDKNTFLPHLYEGSKLGKTFKYEYQDVRLEPELSIDFFNLPDGVIIKKAGNNEEFMTVMKEIDLIRNPLPKIDSIKENKVKLEAKFSTKEKAVIAEVQKKLTLEGELARLDKEREAKKLANPVVLEKKDRTQQIIFIIIVDLIIISLLVYYRRRRKLFRK